MCLNKILTSKKYVKLARSGEYGKAKEQLLKELSSNYPEIETDTLLDLLAAGALVYRQGGGMTYTEANRIVRKERGED